MSFISLCFFVQWLFCFLKCELRVQEHGLAQFHLLFTVVPHHNENQWRIISFFFFSFFSNHYLKMPIAFITFPRKTFPKGNWGAWLYVI